MMVTTSVFRISHSRCFSVMAWRFGRLWLIALSVAAVACAVIGITVDLRLIIIALMLVLLVLPMIAVMLYFNYGLRPEGFVNIMDHSVSFGDEGLTVEVSLPVINDDEDSQSSLPQQIDSPTEVEKRIYNFALQRPVAYIAGTGSLVIPVGIPERGVIIVPYESFGGEENLRRAIDYLRISQ